MSDLISRSALLSKIDEDIKSTEKWMEKIESDIHNKRYDILNSQLNTLKTYRLIIEEQPTAYDVDAVVKDIREYAECDDECAKEYNLGYGCTFCKFNTVINFIRKGGV